MVRVLPAAVALAVRVPVAPVAAPAPGVRAAATVQAVPAAAVRARDVRAAAGTLQVVPVAAVQALGARAAAGPVVARVPAVAPVARRAAATVGRAARADLRRITHGSRPLDVLVRP